jgi:hypothetical protein
VVDLSFFRFLPFFAFSHLPTPMGHPGLVNFVSVVEQLR